MSKLQDMERFIAQKGLGQLISTPEGRDFLTCFEKTREQADYEACGWNTRDEQLSP